MDLLRVFTLYEIGLVTEAFEHFGKLGVAHSCQDGRVRNLVAVEMENGKNSAVASRIQELVDVPTCGEWTGLGFSIANDRAHHKIRIVEGSTARVG